MIGYCYAVAPPIFIIANDIGLLLGGGPYTYAQ